MKLEQRALRFHCGGNALIGIVDVPERPLVRGMLILADSSQYRAGSNRQFTLLSRLLAARGVAVMRFDRLGAGDSEGGAASQGVDDIAAAMKEFFIHVPEMNESVILAPGDAAAGAALYAAGDARVTGLALLDPLLPQAPAAGAPPQVPAPTMRYGPRSAADRLLRRAAAFGRAAGRIVGRETSAKNVPPALAQALGGFGGRVLLVCGACQRAGRDAARGFEDQHPRSRRVEIAHTGLDGRRSAGRDAVAFACASWLGSW
jgi:hypothetical protein